MKRTIASEAYTPQEIGWLAGIIEGEGSIANYTSTYITDRKDRNGKPYKRSVRLYGIVIVNSDLKLLHKVSEIYDKLGVFSHINLKSTSRRQHPASHKSSRLCYEMAVRRRRDVEKLLELVIPWMFGEKKEKAQKLLIDLIATRDNKYARVTTEREAPQNLVRLKRQSELHGNMQS